MQLSGFEVMSIDNSKKNLVHFSRRTKCYLPSTRGKYQQGLSGKGEVYHLYRNRSTE